MHRKASLVLEDAVRNIYTVVAFCVGNKVMELYIYIIAAFEKCSYRMSHSRIYKNAVIDPGL